MKDSELWEGIHCQSSFYIFDKQNIMRLTSLRFVKHKMWDQGVMALIILSSLKLAIDTFLNEKTTSNKVLEFSQAVDFVFNICFFFEMIIKQIAIGFVMDKGSYLNESWNQLDFFIVVSSLFDMYFSDLDIPAIKILRLLRTLRPLRVISHNVALKMIVIALFDSLGGIFNVMVVVFMVWLIFAIMGVNNYGGKF